jgi:transposase
MSEKERKRRGAFEMVDQGKWNLVDASKHLKISYRQCRRSYQRYRLEGDAGLVHRNRGRQSNRAKDRTFRQAVLQRYEQVYEGFGPTLAAEKLEEEGLKVHHETLRRWLIADGKWQRRRKRSTYRQRRERRERFGELVQMDGSHHAWFGSQYPDTCLIKMVDDATGIRKSLMAEQETTEGCMKALWNWALQYGLPKALYTDKKNVFITDRESTLEEQLAGEEPQTAFGKACAKLGIEIIAANSPQAKGRVERAHGVDQDRFIKELKLRGITTVEGANELLASGYDDKINEKFAVQAKNEQDSHHPVPKGMKLAEVFCFEESRVVSNDWVIRYQNRILQISKDKVALPKPKSKVIVRKLLDGTLQLLHENKVLKYSELSASDLKPQVAPATVKAKPVRIVNKPAEDHPWRRTGSFKRPEVAVASRH